MNVVKEGRERSDRYGDDSFQEKDYLFLWRECWRMMVQRVGYAEVEEYSRERRESRPPSPHGCGGG